MYTVFVHVAPHPHGETLRRREHAVRHQVGSLARNRIEARGLPEPAVLALRQRTEHVHAVGEAGHDGRRAIGDRRAAAPPLPPHRIVTARSRRVPSAVASRDASLRSSL